MPRILILAIYILPNLLFAQVNKKINTKAPDPFAPIALFDQIADHPMTNQLVTQEFTNNNNCRVEAAEKFVISTGETWAISEVDILVAQHQGVDNVRITVYDRSPMGTPGATLYDESISISNTTNTTINVYLEQQIVLYSGEYFISVTPIVDASSGNFILTHSAPSSGEQIYVKDPCNIISAGTNWVTPDQSPSYNFQSHDLAVKLTGVICTQNKYVTGTISSSIHRATSSIVSDALISVEGSVFFASKNNVELIPGFCVHESATLDISIKECSSDYFAD